MLFRRVINLLPQEKTFKFLQVYAIYKWLSFRPHECTAQGVKAPCKNFLFCWPLLPVQASVVLAHGSHDSHIMNHSQPQDYLWLLSSLPAANSRLCILKCVQASSSPGAKDGACTGRVCALWFTRQYALASPVVLTRKHLVHSETNILKDVVYMNVIETTINRHHNNKYDILFLTMQTSIITQVCLQSRSQPLPVRTAIPTSNIATLQRREQALSGCFGHEVVNSLTHAVQ